jgi:hypothetical protein
MRCRRPPHYTSSGGNRMGRNRIAFNAQRCFLTNSLHARSRAILTVCFENLNWLLATEK